MTNILIPKKNIIMDSQILTSLMGCPRACNNRFNLNQEKLGGKNNSFECGSLVHVILEYFNKGLIGGKSRTDAIDNGFANGKIYINGCPECIAGKCTKHERQDWTGLQNTPEESTKKSDGEDAKIGWKYVLKTMDEYFDFYKNDFWTPLAAEEVRGSIIYEDDAIRVLWKAKYDQIDDSNDGIISTDHKTMKQRRDSISLNNQFMGQCILLRNRRMRINKIGFQTSLKAHEKFQRVIISYSADRLAEWQFEIVPYYANELVTFSEANFWPPRFTSCESKYGKCDFFEVCENDRGMRSEVFRAQFRTGKKWDVTNESTSE